jgi:hypothetical protein
MKPNKILLILSVSLLLFNNTVLAGDTIKYLTGKCGQIKRGNLRDRENIRFRLANDTLHIWGSINANCCGEHLLIKTQNGNSFNFEPFEIGRVCRCMCFYPFDVKIPQCNLPEYRIKISDKDTTIKSVVSSDVKYDEYQVQKKSIEISVEGSSVIHIYVPEYYKKVTAALYDMLGKEVQILTSINSPEYVWNLYKNLKGVYLLKVKSENSVLVKKIILK